MIQFIKTANHETGLIKTKWALREHSKNVCSSYVVHWPAISYINDLYKEWYAAWDNCWQHFLQNIIKGRVLRIQIAVSWSSSHRIVIFISENFFVKVMKLLFFYWNSEIVHCLKYVFPDVIDQQMKNIVRVFLDLNLLYFFRQLLHLPNWKHNITKLLTFLSILTVWCHM